MVLEEVHFRIAYLLAAIGVLFLLRRPIRYPDRPGSKWFALTLLASSIWLGSVGLYYFVHSLTGSLVLYTNVQFVITVCFLGWFLVAYEFSTRNAPPRKLLYVLGAVAVFHFVALWSNFFWVHELAFQSNVWVDDTGGLRLANGPLFWVHVAFVYTLMFVATTLYAAQWVTSSGLRRKQAAILALTPVVGVPFSLLHLLPVNVVQYDPTPIGVVLAVGLMGWVLYRTEFLDITPIARKTVLERMPDAVVILDDHDRVIDWNDAALELFGVDAPTRGMGQAQFFEGVSPQARETLAGSEGEGEITIEGDTRQRHLSVSIAAIDAGDLEVGRVVVARDITTAKRREEQLVKQNEYLDQFAGIVSHDLQGPLMQIRSTVDLAVRSGNVTTLTDVQDAVDRMQHLVDDLLDLARTGHRLDDVEPVDMATVANRAWERVWSPDAELDLEIDDRILADPGRLQQLLENLFRNSVEHARGEDPATTVGNRSALLTAKTGVESSDTSHESAPTTGNGGNNAGSPLLRVRIGSMAGGFFVEDNGRGIPSDRRERVFERGYSSTEGGTGLGLGIVRQIAGAHGWSVRVTDGSDGGARFEFSGVQSPA